MTNYWVEVEIMKPVDRKGETWQPGQRVTIDRPLAVELQSTGHVRAILKGLTGMKPEVMKQDEEE